MCIHTKRSLLVGVEIKNEMKFEGEAASLVSLAHIGTYQHVSGTYRHSWSVDVSGCWWDAGHGPKAKTRNESLIH